jgi:predicted ATPase with chaperone activity
MTADNVRREHVEKALGSLILADSTVIRIGRAAASRKSALLYGQSGNGKTTVAHALGSAIGGSILIPHAIEAVGQIIRIYDPSKHEALPDKGPAADGVMKSRSDRRWLRIRRPVIWAGGELTKHSLELMFDESLRVYEAPLQLKANGGTLIIDDFGRQQMSPVALLNRWISALEGGIDHLTLHTGQMLEVPFDVLLLFSTNLNPEQLADEAFLRRIRYKVELPNPTREEFRAIVRSECDLANVRYDHHAVEHLLSHWYDAHGREMRGCHPRDIVEAIADACGYEGHDAVLTPATIDEACSTYFLRPAGA